METIKYIPSGVCSREINITIDNDIIKDLNIIGGCPGNLLGIKALCQNQNVDNVIDKLHNIKCGFKNTSCPDQIAKALIEYKNKRDL